MIALISTGTIAGLAGVVLAAGIAKLRRGGWFGAGEVGLAAAALLLPVSVAAAGLAALFAAFTAAHIRGDRAGQDCGCLGDRPAASNRRAGALTAGAALLSCGIAAVAAARGHVPTLLGLAGHRPLVAAVTLAGAAGGAWPWWLAFTGSELGLGEAGERLVDSSALFLERRFSRRTALVRVAVFGSAMTVAPLRYLLYPVSAMAAIVPGDCGGGLCTDGYTAFCCEINHGANTCPEGTFTGGWWMCTDYTGRQLCAEEGVRYYVDCNRLPGVPFPGGCHCADDSCEHRRVACNVFRYGQCSPEIGGVTEVVCRMVVCENPSRIPSLRCSDSLAVDNAVCFHDVPCLKSPAVELGAAGGV